MASIDEKLSQFDNLLKIIMDAHPLNQEIADSVVSEEELASLNPHERIVVCSNYLQPLLRTGHLGLIEWFHQHFPHIWHREVMLNVCTRHILTEQVMTWCYDHIPAFRPTDALLLQASTWHHYNLIYDILRGRWGDLHRTESYVENIKSFAKSIKNLNVMDMLHEVGFYSLLLECYSNPYEIVLYAINGTCSCNSMHCTTHDSHFYIQCIEFYIEILMQYCNFSWQRLASVLLDNYIEILRERGGYLEFIDHCHDLVAMYEPVSPRVMMDGLLYIISGCHFNNEVVCYLEERCGIMVSADFVADFEHYFIGDITLEGFNHFQRIFGQYMNHRLWVSAIIIMINLCSSERLATLAITYPQMLGHLTVDGICDYMHHSEMVLRSDVLNVIRLLKPDFPLHDPDIFYTMRRVIQDREPHQTGATSRRPMHRHSGLDYLVISYPDMYRQVVYHEEPAFWSNEWFREVAYLAVDEEPEVPIARLDLSKFEEDLTGECGICFNEHRPIIVLCRPPDEECGEFRGHVFCKRCIEIWLEQHRTCPSCRKII